MIAPAQLYSIKHWSRSAISLLTLNYPCRMSAISHHEETESCILTTPASLSETFERTWTCMKYSHIGFGEDRLVLITDTPIFPVISSFDDIWLCFIDSCSRCKVLFMVALPKSRGGDKRVASWQLSPVDLKPVKRCLNLAENVEPARNITLLYLVKTDGILGWCS